MYIQLAPLAFRAAGSKFNWSISAILSGVTAVGTLTSVVVNSGIANSSTTYSLKPLKEFITNSSFYGGIEKALLKLKDWGTAIVGSKDAFVEWIQKYLNPQGLKTGIVQLYERLKAWALIVYDWFATKFLKFIENIPKMVKDWDKLRLSLFKWGTFLGGGGGAALWAALGGGADLSKLGDLMNHPKFGEIMENLNELVENNSEALKELGEEGLKEIFEEYLKDPDKANEAAKELNKEKKEREEKAKKEAEENPDQEPKQSPDLTAVEIKEKFKPSSKAGSPPTKAAALADMVKRGLKGMLESQSVFSFQSIDLIKEKARNAMNEYIENLKSDVKNAPKKSEAKEKFLEVINGKEKEFVEGLTKAATKAYQNLKDLTLESLTKEFINSLTTKAPEGEEGDAAPFVKALNANDK